jgi:hypothetical protein
MAFQVQPWDTRGQMHVSCTINRCTWHNISHLFVLLLSLYFRSVKLTDCLSMGTQSDYRGSAVRITTGYRQDGRGVGVRTPVGSKFFFLSTSSRGALGPTQLPIQWVQGSFSPEVKQPGRDADHSHPSSSWARFFSLHKVQIGSGATPNLLYNGYRALFPRR